MNIRQLLQILRLRWWLVVGTALIAMAVAAVVSFRMPKVYTSQTSLLLDVKADPLVATFMPAIASPTFLATQSHIIKSDRVANVVIKRLGLSGNKEATLRWKNATGGKIPLDTYYSNMLENGLAVAPAPGTNVLNITFTASDPKFAAMVANTYAQSYIDFSVDLRVEPAKQYSTWFDQRQKELRAELEQAKTRLSVAHREKGVISSDERADTESARLSALTAQLANAMAERTVTSVRARNSGQETSPDVSESGSVQSLKSQLGMLEAKFTEAGARLGVNHPEYKQLELQVSVARQQMNAEMRRVSGASATVNQVSSQRIADLQALVEAQKQRVIELKSGLGDIDFLTKDVEMAQRAYDAVASRRAQLTLESQSEQAGARILSVAVEPLAPSKPNIPNNILLGTAAGAALGAALAFLMELMDRRIRSVTDLQMIEGIPVLAALEPGTNMARRLTFFGMPRKASTLKPLLGRSA